MSPVTEAALQALKQAIENSYRITVLSGAGMSTESGIPDFRSPGGIWEDEAAMQAMTHSFWRDCPEQFWPKFKAVFMNPVYLNAKPNAGHRALALMEAQGREVTVLTQNVDGLHREAGNSRVYEMHGSIRSAVCPDCRTRYDLDYVLAQDVPRCSFISMKGVACEAILQPDVVLFEQEVRYLGEALRAVRTCDLLLVLGTSLTVYPVADLPRYLNRDRAKLVIINLEETDEDGRADLVIHGKVGEVLERVMG
ncbi:NAD-dependent protein deacylase [Alicyclobacillus cycloheptanicus]|uniref:protein acetyllysine N-acetyltransferase n=1 Tax=Alicyclobacillus cycloheptanicus TaxID=1457 RepID=A0ABT9XIV2_9BACL|nr:NAD-dependent protein deacylase [Alicyclobacillus cycloheptanicus]MDQ0190238.1 NAD-dependent deacetylase [Alicyclobacillus cycloheptanicus]